MSDAPAAVLNLLHRGAPRSTSCTCQRRHRVGCWTAEPSERREGRMDRWKRSGAQVSTTSIEIRGVMLWRYPLIFFLLFLCASVSPAPAPAPAPAPTLLPVFYLFSSLGLSIHLFICISISLGQPHHDIPSPSLQLHDTSPAYPRKMGISSLQ